MISIRRKDNSVGRACVFVCVNVYVRGICVDRLLVRNNTDLQRHASQTKCRNINQFYYLTVAIFAQTTRFCLPN